MSTTRTRNVLCAIAIGVLLSLPGIAEEISTPPESFSFPPSPTRIHIAKGLWWHFFRITEAGALMGGAIYDESFDVHGRTNYHGYGKTLGDFPRTAKQFFDYHVIVITGSRANALSEGIQMQLRDWVVQGGGLLVTGGIQGLGRGKYSGTVLEGLLPATVSEEDDFKKTSPGAVLSPTAKGSEFFGNSSAWNQKPLLFYRHGDLVLKDGARVLLESEGQPVLITWNTGKGRVALFAGTVCGDPQPGELPFWEWDGWPRLLARTLQWLAETPLAESSDGAAPAGKEYQSNLRQLKELTDINVEGLFDEDDPKPKTGDRPDTLKTILQLAVHCRDRVYALAVVKALEESGTVIKPELAETLFDSISRYVSGQLFSGPGKALATSPDSGRAALGIRVLASAKLPEGIPFALRYLANGLGGLSGNSKTGLAATMRVETGEDERFRLAAVRALADYSDENLLPAFRKSAAGWNVKSVPSPAIAELQKDLSEEIQLVLCQLGDGEAAENVVNLMVRNRLKIDENLDVTQQPLYVPTPTLVKERKRLADEIPHLRARNARAAVTLARFPRSGLPFLAKNAATWKGDQASEYLQACLARRMPKETLTSEERKALTQIIRECKLQSVRALCYVRLNPSGQEAISLLSDLVAGDEAAAGFSLSQCAALPEPGRAALIRLGLDHRSRKVRHNAARAIVLAAPGEQETLSNKAKLMASEDEVLKAILAR
ncbi:MAG: glutamine amidotransferase [Planctomycetota bacterium]|nr:glutamine amidotransferase [Planctomycetota bacterium]